MGQLRTATRFGRSFASSSERSKDRCARRRHMHAATGENLHDFACLHLECWWLNHNGGVEPALRLDRYVVAQHHSIVMD